MKVFDKDYRVSYRDYFHVFIYLYVMLCPIWFYLYNFKNLKIIHRGVTLLVKLQTEGVAGWRNNTPPLMFFTFFKLQKWYQITQTIIYRHFCIVLPFCLVTFQESKTPKEWNICMKVTSRFIQESVLMQKYIIKIT